MYIAKYTIHNFFTISGTERKDTTELRKLSVLYSFQRTFNMLFSAFFICMQSLQAMVCEISLLLLDNKEYKGFVKLKSHQSIGKEHP